MEKICQNMVMIYGQGGEKNFGRPTKILIDKIMY
jgi:hypothetical protein